MVPIRVALVAVVSLIVGAGSQNDETSSIRITAPLHDWVQPQDLPVAVAFFAIWPPCSAQTSKRCAGGDREMCENLESRRDDEQCETQLFLDGQQILTHTLTAENQYAFSGVLPAHSLHLGSHRLSVDYTCVGPHGGSEPRWHGHSTKFSVVEMRTWEELGHDGEAGEHLSDAEEEKQHAPDIPASSMTGESRDQDDGSPGRPNVKCAVMIYHANVMQVSGPYPC